MLIKTVDLSLRYKDGNDNFFAVKNVNISFPEKGLFGIVGPSGSGKSSLLYLLSGIKYATSGQIIFDGQKFPQNASQRNKIRKQQMGFVFQQHFLINYLNVEQNILIGAHKIDHKVKEKSQELIERLDLNGLQKRLPYKLSGGQRQRVAIVRALINQPKVLFADEPTAAIDHKTGEKVLDYLKDFAQEHCVIVVTHDESFLPKMDKYYAMRDGEII
jgi:putative ABC transport system ATP-binding protein